MISSFSQEQFQQFYEFSGGGRNNRNVPTIPKIIPLLGSLSCIKLINNNENLTYLTKTDQLLCTRLVILLKNGHVHVHVLYMTDCQKRCWEVTPCPDVQLYPHYYTAG